MSAVRIATLLLNLATLALLLWTLRRQRRTLHLIGETLDDVTAAADALERPTQVR